MAMARSEAAFEGRAPAINQIVEKITQLSGLRLVTKEYDPGIPNLHDSVERTGHLPAICNVCRTQRVFQFHSPSPEVAGEYLREMIDRRGIRVQSEPSIDALALNHGGSQGGVERLNH